MSMTREEIIHEYEDAVAAHAVAAAAGIKGAEKSYELFKAGLDALRPVSREQVEKMKGVWIFNDDWWEFRCSECHKGIGNIEKFKFCPHCGAPMTDEAVDMVMERLEALHGEKD